MHVPKLKGYARGLAVFQRQIAYPCAKYKARKAFLLFSGVLYGWRSVFSRAACKEIGLELKILCSEAHFLCIKHQISLRADLANTM